jgi:drug/metabolite transporter (DMT)-like permease
MKPDSPNFDDSTSDGPTFDGDEQPPLPNSTGSSSFPNSPATNDSAAQKHGPSSFLGPLETLQRRYSDQLSQDIERLEAEKAQLQTDIATLKDDCKRLLARQLTLAQAMQASLIDGEPSPPAEVASLTRENATDEADAVQMRTDEVRTVRARIDQARIDQARTDQPRTDRENVLSLADARAAQPKMSLLVPTPRLPGEPAVPTSSSSPKVARGPIELPIPSTSEQRQQRSRQRPAAVEQRDYALLRKGLALSAIAAILMAWHFCVMSALAQGGGWLGLTIEQLGAGFVPAVALLWLRMLVMLPALVLLAPQLYKYTWEDLHDWVYNQDRLLTMLIGSGVALFFSQVLIYQCIGIVGPVIGAMLLFLYPLTAVPLNALLGPDRKLSPLGLLAMVAIAMGGVLAIRPILGALVGPNVSITNAASSTILLGILAGIAFSLYVTLTNLSYRQQQCHPIPVSMVQFSTVAVLSSVVLLVKPLQPVAIDWLSFSLWGILLGLVMLLVYLFSYSSLRLIGSRTSMVAAATPLATLLIAWSFSPTPVLVVLQWTGILLVSVGGIALGKEKLNSARR